MACLKSTASQYAGSASTSNSPYNAFMSPGSSIPQVLTTNTLNSLRQKMAESNHEMETISMVKGWCPSSRHGRPSDSKSTYKDNYIYLSPKALAGLEPRFSRIQDLSFYH
ncbi:hypothetical protein MTR_4g123150 [Medicago truncatula]|uniref:Uncharacterized protein n=1 Tax=Medicago truncatula TaxID=3880 RepID=A0A072UST1_MEDTR|nr:hypothetical protein MTR_4g123150 [Medicago truncatula]